MAVKVPERIYQIDKMQLQMDNYSYQLMFHGNTRLTVNMFLLIFSSVLTISDKAYFYVRKINL